MTDTFLDRVRRKSSPWCRMLVSVESTAELERKDHTTLDELGFSLKVHSCLEWIIGNVGKRRPDRFPRKMLLLSSVGSNRTWVDESLVPLVVSFRHQYSYPELVF